MKRRALLALLIVLAASATVSAQNSEELDKIVVTPSSVLTELGESSRSATVLNDALLEGSVYKAIPDAIGELGGIDMRRRGPEGVQADISIRATSFEENSSMIDGVKTNDPQTGHFNTDWPVTMMDIERVEIVKGPSSSVYGPNAFGGVVNLVTRKPSGREFLAYSEGGSYDYFDTGLSASASIGSLKNRFSVEQRRSTGYRPETHFNIFTLTDTALLETPVGNYDFLFGYMYKNFGASDFYSSQYPNEEERTDTRFFKIGGVAESGDLRMEPRVFLRAHKDKFALDANRPGWQTNFHTTYYYGFDARFLLENPFADTVFGYELSRDTIDSTNIQTHSRTTDGIYASISPHLADALYLNAGLRGDYFGQFGWQFSPSVSASLKVSSQLVLRGLVGRAYRIPTFTDLYYNDAASRGNDSLNPENCWSYESGADLVFDGFSYSMTYFHRDTYDTIDWIRYSAAAPWQASNIGTSSTNGIEAKLAIKVEKLCRGLPVESVFIDYTGLDTYAKHDYYSKYALDYLKQHICFGADCYVLGFKNSWVLNYRKSSGGSDSVVVDLKFTKEIVKKSGLSFDAYLGVENLFDESYSEQSGVGMPGRWIKSGLRLAF